MLLRFFFLTAIICCQCIAQAQTKSGTWTWIGGDSVHAPSNLGGNRGLKGIAHPSNYPHKFVPSSSYVWKDKTNKLWFISNSYDNAPNKDTIEIWTYQPETNLWTWVAGYDSIEFVNTPASIQTQIRNRGIYFITMPTWTDSLGNCWYMLDNLIIKFDIQTLKLELMRTSGGPDKGTKGVASTSNWPDMRGWTSTWTIGNNAYLFGGRNSTSFNDLWKFDMNTMHWTWLGGGDQTSPYSYGTKGIASSSNWPPPLSSSISQWSSANKLYLYGGNNSVYDLFGDLWEYDVSTGLWIWLSGSGTTTGIHPGIYPSSVCKDTGGAYPSARYVRNMVKTRVCNNSYWLYGGYDYNSADPRGKGYSDLWLYKPLENKWVWVDGLAKDTTYSFGQKYISSPFNKPPIRFACLVWTDNQDRLYVFGGFSYRIFDAANGTYVSHGNDLWRYDPDYSCINYSLSEKFIDRNIKYKICQGDSTVVKVRAGYDSLRVVPMSAEVSIRVLASGAEVTLKPSATKSYKVIAYGYRCESLLDSLTVPIVVSPPRTSSEAKTICYGASYMGKNTSGTYSYNYPDPLKCDSLHTLYLTVRLEIINNIDTTVCEGTTVFGRSVSGTYNDLFTASNGCDSTRRLRLTVIPRNLTIDTAICRGQSLAGYNAAGTYYDTLTSTQGCVTYRVIKLTIKEPSSSSHTQAICEGQSYWGHSTTGTHSDILLAANGCDSTRTLNLTVNPKSYFTLTKEICRGDNYEGKSAAGTYLDTFLNANGCDSIRTLVLTLRNPRVIKKLKDTAICRGSEAIFDAGIGHINYLWTTGASTPSIRVSQLGEYKLNYTDTANCVGRDSAKLSFYNDTEIILEDEISNYKGELLILNPKIVPSDVGGRYRWSPSHIFSCDSCRSVRFRLDSSAIIQLQYTDAQGCKAYKDVKVNIYDSWAVGFPSAFSPNGDSLNDTYFPNVANILSYTYAVYNRWGEKVYQATNMQPAWNGTYKGHPVPTGMYSYYAEVVLLNGVKQTYSGSFQVVR
jgi:gliding motility-associated-like protein